MSPRVIRLGTLLALVSLTGLCGVWLASRVLAPPEAAALGPTDPLAGVRAQHRLAELLLRAGGVSGRDGPLEIPAMEVNALLARHVQARGLPLTGLALQAGAGTVELVGRTSLRQVGPRSTLGWLPPLLPDALLDLDLWVFIRGRLSARPGGAELVVERAALGRQPVPAGWLWGFLGVDPREHLAWRLPRTIERIEARPGRLVIHTRRR
jgi:hypothetical protein